MGEKSRANFSLSIQFDKNGRVIKPKKKKVVKTTNIKLKGDKSEDN